MAVGPDRRSSAQPPNYRIVIFVLSIFNCFRSSFHSTCSFHLQLLPFYLSFKFLSLLRDCYSSLNSVVIDDSKKVYKFLKKSIEDFHLWIPITYAALEAKVFCQRWKTILWAALALPLHKLQIKTSLLPGTWSFRDLVVVYCEFVHLLKWKISRGSMWSCCQNFRSIRSCLRQ